MSCSDVRLAANRANPSKSTGPKTASGKDASRRNARTHGLTGRGIVVPGEDAAAIEARFARIEAELAGDGSTAMRVLAQRTAVLAGWLEGSAHHDSAATLRRSREAEA